MARGSPLEIECTVFSLQPVSPSQVNARLMTDDQLDGERPELAANGGEIMGWSKSGRSFYREPPPKPVTF
uniref:Uncharacterized protein n=1 Tax=Anopheles atroparvus TaxID=41427 RepID=A0A182IXL4_ANOAO